ncbi:hypothetical protein V8G54_022621 [Vigna mungo]|uniref:Uncharacterized protein n=1 Tax=Vigna mungo TaxID=3915 RepID=A0AAQ3N1N0_VIGMU
MKGDCYYNLVEVFFHNVREVDGNIHSRVKGVDIIINNDTWWRIAKLKDAGRYKKEKGFLLKWLDKEEKVIAFFIGYVLLPGRYNLIKLTPTDVCLLNAIVQKIPTNWVAIFKRQIL